MKHVVEDDDAGMVEIDGRKIDGWIDDATCPTCTIARVYYTEFDAFFCPDCNKWLESKCSDPTCEYCKKRPDKPLT